MPTAEPVLEYVVTAHAAFEMTRRGISDAMLREVLAAPEQRAQVRNGRDVLQSRFHDHGVAFLIRVFVDVDRRPAEVVTAYRTSKIAKYWRQDS